MADPGWSFHGVYCSKSVFDEWKAKVAGGVCPWCGKALSKRYRSTPAHLRSCPKKPGKYDLSGKPLIEVLFEKGGE